MRLGRWRDSGSTSSFCFFLLQADRVVELRAGAEVEYLRKVAAVKGESFLGLSDYRYK